MQQVTDAARATFSLASGQYALARPQYPAEMFQWLADGCGRHELALDCATGNGQAAVGLSPFFRQDAALDMSEEQIAHRIERDNITYSVASAEATGMPDHSADLVVVAQALHWFDYDRFWPEISRVAHPGALFCAWGYDWPLTDSIVLERFIVPFRSLIDAYWAPNNKLLWDGYRPADVRFPFEPLPTPDFSIRVGWRLEDLVTYMTTWSAYKRARENPTLTAELDALIASAADLVPEEDVLSLEMPLRMLAGRVG
jgi:hypothetical protein